MTFFEFFQMLGSNIWIYGGAFLLVLSLLVFVHEWGHYIVARWCGVKVEIFSIGFGKEILGFNDKNGTRWKFSLVPLGGYVKLFGDVDPASAAHDDSLLDEKTGKPRKFTAKERKQAFFAKPVWQRALVVLAGPGINYLFALALLAGLFVVNGKPVKAPVAAAVIGGSSAAEHGFLPHDYVVSIDGKPATSFDDIRRAVIIGLDQEQHFVVRRGNRLVDIYAKPEKIEEEDQFGFKTSRGLLGLLSGVNAVDIKTIVAIDGVQYSSVQAVRRNLIQRFGSTFEIDVDRGNDEIQNLIIHPVADYNEGLRKKDAPDHDILMLTSIEPSTFVRYNPAEAVLKAGEEVWSVTIGTLEALGQMITGSRSAHELGGIIRIGAVAGDMAQQGVVALVLFMALLSVNLGLINLFPVPMLDGGHLLFYIFEAAMGRPIPDRIQEYAFRFGLIFLVGIMAFANLNDLMQLVL